MGLSSLPPGVERSEPMREDGARPLSVSGGEEVRSGIEQPEMVAGSVGRGAIELSRPCWESAPMYLLKADMLYSSDGTVMGPSKGGSETGSEDGLGEG